MKDLLSLIITQIVSLPDQVVIEETDDGHLLTLQFSVAPQDMGKVIGKSGRIIRAIRDLIRVRAVKENRHVNVVLLENSPSIPA